MYDPIYSSNIGLCGFRCRVVSADGSTCRKVVPTYRGILMHCKRVHGLVAQMKLFDTPVQAENQDGVMTPIAKEAIESGKVKTSKKPKLVRAERAKPDDADLELWLDGNEWSKAVRANRSKD